MKIYKYGPLLVGEGTTIELPRFHKIVHFGLQENEIMLWALVDGDVTDVVKITFKVIPTGYEYSYDDWEYLSTVTIENGHPFNLVWHILQKRKEK